MANISHLTSAPQSSSDPPHTPRATSIPDDSSTEYEPTPVHSPGGPQYEDLPPSYDFALGDARNGGTALDASQIEAHRVSANEGPNEPEVWEYRMRSEIAEESQEHEEAPAYEGLASVPHAVPIPIQHVPASQNIPVGRVEDLNPAITSATRSTAIIDDPPHSIPDGSPGPVHGTPVSHWGQQPQTWGPLGAPGNGPFGASGNGPFGASGNGPFGASWNGPFGAPGSGPFSLGRGSAVGGNDYRGRGRRGRVSRSSQDWAAFGQNMGRLGGEFGRRMGNWGEQFGRQAGAMGKQFGQRSEQWASAYSAGGGGYAPVVRPTATAGPSTAEPSGPPQYDHPPSYEAPVGAARQESGVVNTTRDSDTYPLEKVPQSPSEKPSTNALGNQRDHDHHYEDDDDDSSITSDSSGSSSSSDSDDDDYDDTQATFLKRIDSINKAAELAASKGKKSREEIEHERDLAIAKATREKRTAEQRFARRQARRTQKRILRDRKRELTREYRQRKRELRERSEGRGKGKGKAKKGTDWKELKKEYKAKRRALKRDRVDAKREWKRERRDTKRGSKEGSVVSVPEQKVLSEKA